MLFAAKGKHDFLIVNVLSFYKAKLVQITLTCNVGIGLPGVTYPHKEEEEEKKTDAEKLDSFFSSDDNYRKPSM